MIAKLKESLAPVKYGYVHALYGNGKGKTTSAVGIAMRAAGAGLDVSFVQFMKDGSSNEMKIIERVPNIEYFCPGEHDFVDSNLGMSELQREHALLCMEYLHTLPKEKNLLICDEIFNVPLFAIRNPPFTYEDIADYIRNKPLDLEVVLTGLYVPDNLIKSMDYASEIREVKHVFNQNVLGRRGIEF